MRNMLAGLALAASALCAMSAHAGPGLQQELETQLRAYHKAILDGNTQAALSLASRESRRSIEKEFAASKNRGDDIALWQAMTPDDYAAEHAEPAGGKEAVLYGIGTKRLPPEEAKRHGRPSARFETITRFRKEGDAWRVHENTISGDPDRIKRSADERYEGEGAFRDDRTMTLEGRVVKTRFGKDHTVVVLRVLDEEIVTFHPGRAELERFGVDFGLFEPWRHMLIKGKPHKSDPLKVFVLGMKSAESGRNPD